MTTLTKNSIAYNRTLFLEDNLPVLRGLDSDSIDLIATDPPFNKGVPAFTGTTKAGENVEFKDIWNWNDDVHVDWMNAIFGKHPSLYAAIHAANKTAGDDMGAFLCWMAVRVLEMHRVLKPTGSIYLHCDQTASHYLKAMMDAIFGRENFRNEIVWRRTVRGFKGSQFLPLSYNVNTDSILFYVKTSDAVFDMSNVLEPYAPNYLAKAFKLEDERGVYYLDVAFNRRSTSPRPNLCYEYKGFFPPYPSGWKIGKPRMEELDRDGDIVVQNDQLYRKVRPKAGRIRNNLWDDVGEAKGKERTGYPTQKPLALYKRMIEASSNPGDMVLDPFAGCATTCVAAEQLGRQWIGIDIREESGDVIRERLENEVNENMAWDAIVRTPTEAPERTDGGAPVVPELAVVGRKRNARRIPVSKLRGDLVERDGLRCQGCGWVPHQVDYLQVDHNQPKSLQGTDEMDNLALLCDPCNCKKSNKLTIHELRQARANDGDWMNMEWWEKEKWKR